MRWTKVNVKPEIKRINIVPTVHMPYYGICRYCMYVMKTKILCLKYQSWASAIQVFSSATTQYCGQPNLLQSCGLKKLRNCDCGPSKFDFRNSVTLHSLLPIPLLSTVVPFHQLRMVLKINQKYLQNCLFLWKKNCLKGTVAKVFYL